MKKPLIILLVTFAMNVISAQTNTYQKKEHTKIIITKAPKSVSGKFAAQYPGVKPAWSLDGENYLASYVGAESKLKHFVLYSKEGEVISKESEMDYTEYPISINKYYSQRFPEEKFRIVKCEAPNSETYYFAKHKESIIKFDTDGNYISDRGEKVKFSNGNKGQMAN